jgi:uncharacterized protein YecE (DUF72 family)
MTEGRIRIGVGGWTFAPWRGRFYPEGLPQARELAHASARLTAIEVNGTFYRTQKPATFAAWAEAAPEGFVFALKAPRYATNRRVLAEAGESVARFVASGIAELGDKLGPVNWQFAPTKTFEAEDFARFLDLLPEAAGNRRLRHVVEVRHSTFQDGRFLNLVRERGMAVVLAGDSAHPRIDAPSPELAYARIMGTRASEAAGYAPAELDAWADWARGEAAAGREVFLFVIAGEKALNPAAAMALIERVQTGASS